MDREVFLRGVGVCFSAAALPRGWPWLCPLSRRGQRGVAALSSRPAVSSRCTECPWGPGARRLPPVLVCLPRTASWPVPGGRDGSGCRGAGGAGLGWFGVDLAAWQHLEPGQRQEDAEPGLVRARPAQQHPRCRAVTVAMLTCASPSTQTPPRSCHRGLAIASSPIPVAAPPPPRGQAAIFLLQRSLRRSEWIWEANLIGNLVIPRGDVYFGPI